MVAIFYLGACGGRDHAQSNVGPPAIEITVAPSSVILAPGAQQQFIATVTGSADQATWAVLEGTKGGSVSSDGLYVAPATAGTFHVSASLASDPSKNALATITVTGSTNFSLTIEPLSVVLQVGASQNFQATVVGSSNTSVVWAVEEPGGGTIDGHGDYTAPSAPGTFHVVATSLADTSTSAVATITVETKPPNIAVSITPTTANLQVGGQQQFTAVVSGSSEQAVLWSISEGSNAGTITPDGLYTAPSVAGVFHVTATAQIDSTKSSTATVAVTTEPPPISVSISPSSTSLITGENFRFSATVTGTSNQAVDWSMQETTGGGAIDGTGRYTAPGNPGTFHVVATSHADGTKHAIASVVVTASITIAISPASTSLTGGGTMQFHAAVGGTSNGSVTWSIEEGTSGGTIDASGFYVAPQTSGNYHVVVTSNADPSKNAVAAVSVTTSPVHVTISPANVAIPSNVAWRFSASVSGASDTSVTWSVSEGSAGGTIDSTGQYISPLTSGQYHVTATSNADQSVSTTAVVRTNTLLADAGGQIVPAIAVYTIWWGSKTTFGDAPTQMGSLFGALGGTGYLKTLDQYMRGATATVSFAGSLFDASSPPLSVPSPSQIQTEICGVLDGNGLSPRTDAIYMLYVDNAPPASFSGYHQRTTCHGTTVWYAFILNVVAGATGNTNDACGRSLLDHVFGVIGVHELFETMTDAEGNAWTDGGNAVAPEIADKCSYEPVFNCGTTLSDGSSWQLPMMWSNSADECVFETQ